MRRRRLSMRSSPIQTALGVVEPLKKIEVRLGRPAEPTLPLHETTS